MHRKMLLCGFIFLLMFCVYSLPARQPLAIRQIQTPPVIDGNLDDAAWKEAKQFTGFKTFNPDYGTPASEKTVVYMTYDSEHLYFAIRCSDSHANKIKASVSKRDSMFDDDWVAVCLDTFNDQQTAYGFLVNPLGIQGDGKLNYDGDLDDSMDMVWYSKGKLDDKGYSIELMIPIKSIRFPAKKKITMGMWLVRKIVRTSEDVSFPELFPDKGATLGQIQPIVLEGLKYKRIAEVLPAATHSRGDSIRDGSMAKGPRDSDISVTGKVGITSQLTLDGTYNPDFSQIEADAGEVDINLRHAIFYQEKRPFFLEGNDIFNFAGNTEDAPLMSIIHTRNIIEPQFGLKLSGKISRRTTVAALYARDESTGIDYGDKANFSIFRFRHGLGDDSYVGGFYTGRDMSDRYNRVAGIDGRFRINGLSQVEYHAMGSFSNDPDTDNSLNGHAAAIRYNYGSRNFIMDAGIQDISGNFRTDTGFVTRTGITRLALFGMYRFYPKKSFFQRIEPFYWSFHIRDKASGLWETCNLFTLRLHMPGQSQFRLDVIAANEVFAGQRFDRNGIGFQVSTQITKKIYLSFWNRYSGSLYYDPDNPYQGRGYRASLFLRYQPTEKFDTSLSINYSDFYRSADSEKIYDYMILRSRNTFQFNKYLFFRGIAEYNTYRESLLLDFLASFTYIPGTVIHVGYGSVFEKISWDPTTRDYLESNRFLETKRGLFIKVSYLWRL